jgi:hypothetical protein
VSSREEIKAAIAKLVKDGATMAADLRKKEKPEGFVFNFSYQHWYSKALPVMRTLGADRYEEFKRYYEPDPKRKALGYGTYVIQGFVKGTVPGGYEHKDFDTEAQRFAYSIKSYSFPLFRRESTPYCRTWKAPCSPTLRTRSLLPQATIAGCREVM